jgi:tetratricopeptide (TPR) repeat protein
MRLLNFLGATALALAAAAPTSAAWHQATSKHFVIYGDMPESELRDYATKLEKFDAAARLIRSMKDPTVGDGNRVQVLVVSSMLEVNRLYGQADAGVGGYYVGSVNGPFIVTPQKIRRLNTRTDRIDPEVVFFHEYTHHLQLQSTQRPMPQWLTEGFAEFLGNPIFGEDGSVGIGAPAKDRAAQLIKGRWAPMADLLEGNAFRLGQAGFGIQNYAQGWLLNHYLAFEPSRKGQIEKYVSGIENGQNALDAARAAFGDLGVLESELRAYLKRKSLPFLKIDSTKLTVPPVTITAMSAGADEVMPLRLHVKTGYASVSTGYVLGKVRDIAKRYPNDLIVLRTLAEAEFDSKNYDEAIAAAEAVLKLDPRSTEGLIYKGRGILAKAKKANDPAQFAEARKQFLAANRLDPEDPEALFLYYRTYRAANVAAPKSAVEALHYASILAPRDFGPAVQLVTEHLRQNNLKGAADALRPLAYLPHAGQSRSNEALTVLGLIEAGKRDEALAMAQDKFFPKKDENPN